MDYSTELIDWTQEYMALVNADFGGTVPAERQILENSRLLIMNNAACHLAHLAPIEFLSTLPASREYFFSRPLPWWLKEAGYAET